MNPFTIVEIQLSVIAENLANAFWGSYEIEVKKDEEHYRLNINVDYEQIGSIDINWKGIDEDKYLKDLLDIMYEFLSKKAA